MTAEQFLQEVGTLESRVAEMPDQVAGPLLEEILKSRRRCTPRVDDKLAQLQWQLIIAGLSHPSLHG